MKVKWFGNATGKAAGSRWGAGNRKHVASLLAVALVTVGGVTLLHPQTAVADSPTTVFEINDVSFTADAKKGDGVCSTTATPASPQPNCTLRAALEELNSKARAKGEVLITLASDPQNPGQPLPLDQFKNRPSGQPASVTLVNGTSVQNITVPLPASSSTNMMTSTAPYAAVSNGTYTYSPALPSSGGWSSAQANGNWTTTTQTAATNNSPGGDGGSYFVVSQPVTIDLKYQLTFNSGTSDSYPAAVFYLNAADITLTGLYNIYSSETAIYVGPMARNANITNGQVTISNYNPERYLVVRGGSRNTTLSYHSIAGFGYSGNDFKAVTISSTSTTNPVDGLTIDHVRYLANASGSCVGSSAVGCSSSGIFSYGTQYITDLTFTNNYLSNLNRANDTDASIVDVGYASVRNLVIDNNVIDAPFARSGNSLVSFNSSSHIHNLTVTNNSVIGMTGNYTSDTQGAFIYFPDDEPISGTGLVANNYVQYSGGSGTAAIYWNSTNSGGNNVNSSNVKINNNYFDWDTTTNTPAVRLLETGLLDASQNIYSANSQSQTTTPSEESNATGAGLMANWNNSANAKLNTWYPFARTSANAQTTVVQANACTIPLEVAPPSDYTNNSDTTGAKYPQGTEQNPVYVDVYWTGLNDAEAYLGRYPVWGGSASGSGTTLATVGSTSTGPTAHKTLDIRLPLPNDAKLSHTFGAGALVAADADGTAWVAPTAPTNVSGTAIAAGNPNGSFSGLTTPTVASVVANTEPATSPYGYPDTTGRLNSNGRNNTSAPGTSATYLNGTISVAGPVDTVTGAVSGYLRLQTIDPTLNSAMPAVSNFSRVAQIGGTCAPTLTLNQADGVAAGTSKQLDPTLVRLMHFTLTSSMPLDLTTVTVDDFELTAALVPTGAATRASLVTDPADLHAQIVSVTPVGTTNSVFDVVVSVDDSATVTLTLPAIKVNADADSTLGLPNINAATFTDNSITFQNPITVNPTSVSVVAHDANPKPFAVKLTSGAPAPKSPVSFAASVEQLAGCVETQGSVTANSPAQGQFTDSGWDESDVPCVFLADRFTNSEYQPTIAAGTTVSGQVGVISTEGNVTGGTRLSIALATATSDDPFYNGLVAPNAVVVLYATNAKPILDITGYIQPTTGTPAATLAAASTDPAVIASITGSWTPVCDTGPLGANACTTPRMEVSRPVCYVYTATNRDINAEVTWGALHGVMFYTSETTLRDTQGNPASSGLLNPDVVGHNPQVTHPDPVPANYYDIEEDGALQLIACGVTHPDATAPTQVTASIEGSDQNG